MSLIPLPVIPPCPRCDHIDEDHDHDHDDHDDLPVIPHLHHHRHRHHHSSSSSTFAAPVTSIDGGPDIYVSLKSRLALVCRIASAGLHPHYLIWRKGGKVKIHHIFHPILFPHRKLPKENDLPSFTCVILPDICSKIKNTFCGVPGGHFGP